MPAQALGTNQVSECLGSGVTRNYSYLYDKTLYASLWVAYPLTKSHTTGNASTSNWRYNPSTNIPHESQVGVTGTTSYPTLYGAEGYAKGHQCPNADRKSDNDMNTQTYYVTNQTPQIQNGFNSGVWSRLEEATRALTESTDTVYVITGPCYRKKGGNETITYLHSTTVTPASLPVPNYYWKVLLKVKRSGDSITSASAIGFWFEHKSYTDNYTNYAVSVDTIEQYTGFDLFANLPNSIEAAAERNASWTTFQNF